MNRSYFFCLLISCAFLFQIKISFADSINTPSYLIDFSKIEKSKANLEAIGKKIYQNECQSNPDNLLFWNPQESFPSIGIAHFIWLPAQSNEPFKAVFPEFLAFLQENHPNKMPPIEFSSRHHAPWSSRSEFYQLKKSGALDNLQLWLEKEQSLQVQFIVWRFEQQTLKMLETVEQAQRKSLKTKILDLMKSDRGGFALIDYSNFKGFGDNDSERYKKQGWGLLQVLQHMPTSSVDDFKIAAKKVLQQRVANSPQQKEKIWLKGWLKRVNAY